MDAMTQSIRPPAVLGQPIIDPAAWTGKELAACTDWKYELTSQEANQLIDMAKQLQRTVNGDLNGLLKLKKDAFVLGDFSKKIEQLSQQLANGLGLVLIRGLPMHELDLATAATIYFAVGSHLGQPKSNNAEGDLLSHVTDIGKSYADPNSRGYQTKDALDYHCDQTSIVGLYCVRAAREGGQSKIASSVSVYNALLQHSPESVAVLSEPFYWTRHGEVNPGESPFYQSPVFNVLDDKLCVSFGPRHIEKGHALPGAPALTELQRNALALAETVAEELSYSMELCPGDMQFLNNFVVLHRRTAYTDWPQEEKKRLLWRMWLSSPELRPATQYIKQWEQGVKLNTTRERIAV